MGACGFVSEARDEFFNCGKRHGHEQCVNQSCAQHPADNHGAERAPRNGARAGGKPQRQEGGHVTPLEANLAFVGSCAHLRQETLAGSRRDHKHRLPLRDAASRTGAAKTPLQILSAINSGRAAAH